MPIPTLPGISSEQVDTGRIRMHVLRSGPAQGEPVLFIHGNGSSATFWEEVMLALPTGYRGFAPDLRGYGDTEPLPVDATLGLGDMVADVLALAETLGLARYHLVGHSMGGGVVMKVALAAPEAVRTLTLVDTMSPYGYGGCKGPDGQLTYDDGAPAGINPDFVRLMDEGERGTEDPMAPRNVLRQFYVKPPFVHEREEELLSGMLSVRIGDDWYPGTMVPSNNWPGVAPGKKGIIPAFNAIYFDASDIATMEPQPPILWIRGADDLIVGDNAMFDLAALGAMGAMPGYPGVEECPPQPMLVQIRTVLEAYEANGGHFKEVAIADAGHSPFLEKPAVFNEAFHAWITGSDAA